ncbi:hypothetical protein H6P81_021493 [Aristolochia fimbriata]|uniref:Cytochrome c assembly protein domain-containing protein n=1 Tax=Aristolochia fimbriata TaxID=158543 RepID=A0AAV7DSE1_ARIFI|nr:hypothetical protein H6P81_021493 [Aristolochia fimbriata]
MAIHSSLRVAPPDLQQGGNSRIPYVHVPAARISILVYIATAINSFLFPLTKHPLFLRSSGTGIEMGAFSTLFTLVTGGFRGRPMWGTFRVWDARLTSVFISFLIYLGALCFQKLPVEPAPISIRAGPIDIPIIKSPVNWWNTSHQPGSISRSGRLQIQNLTSAITKKFTFELYQSFCRSIRGSQVSKPSAQAYVRGGLFEPVSALKSP